MSVGFNQTTIELIELPSLPDEVPYVFDDCSLAFSLGFRNKVMWYILENKKAMYTVHRIPKKKRGHRIIHAPQDMMKLLLRQLHVRYLVPLQDQLGQHVTAYRKGLSCRHAVEQHVPPCVICDAAGDKTPKSHECPRKGLYVHMDLKDFFPSTSRAMIRNYFKQIGYNHDVSSLLANLLTVSDFPNPKYRRKKKLPKGAWVPEFFSGVPQGSPASGAICNLVADWRIDFKIMEYLSDLNDKYNLEGVSRWVYTRYCDDLSFTCGRTFTKEETQQFINDIKSIVHNAGYRVNPDKTRIAHGYYGRRLLGTVFNQKPNIPDEEYRRVRAITHNCLVHGFESQAARAKQPNGGALFSWLRGKINYMAQINPHKGEKLMTEFTAAVEKHGEGGVYA